MKIHDMPSHSFAILNVQECGVEHLANEFLKMYDWKCIESLIKPFTYVYHHAHEYKNEMKY